MLEKKTHTHVQAWQAAYMINVLFQRRKRFRLLSVELTLTSQFTLHTLARWNKNEVFNGQAE